LFWGDEDELICDCVGEGGRKGKGIESSDMFGRAMGEGGLGWRDEKVGWTLGGRLIGSVSVSHQVGSAGGSVPCFRGGTGGQEGKVERCGRRGGRHGLRERGEQKFF